MVKRKQLESLESVLSRPWCYYCEKDFDDLKICIDHQKAKHFQCMVGNCHRRLNTVGGLKVHMQQVHKEELHETPNALEGRKDLNLEIFGMEGVPQELVEQRTAYVTEQYHRMAEDYRKKTGNPLPGSVPPEEASAPKRQRTEDMDEVKRRVREIKARRDAEKAAKAAGLTIPKPADSPSSAAAPAPGAPAADKGGPEGGGAIMPDHALPAPAPPTGPAAFNYPPVYLPHASFGFPSSSPLPINPMNAFHAPSSSSPVPPSPFLGGPPGLPQAPHGYHGPTPGYSGPPSGPGLPGLPGLPMMPMPAKPVNHLPFPSSHSPMAGNGFTAPQQPPLPVREKYKPPTPPQMPPGTPATIAHHSSQQSELELLMDKASADAASGKLPMSKQKAMKQEALKQERARMMLAALDGLTWEEKRALTMKQRGASKTSKTSKTIGAAHDAVTGTVDVAAN